MRLALAIRATPKASQASLQVRKIKNGAKEEATSCDANEEEAENKLLSRYSPHHSIPTGTIGSQSQSQPQSPAETQGTNTQADASQSWTDGADGVDTSVNTQSYAGWAPVPRKYLPSEEKVWENRELVTPVGGEGLGEGLSGEGAGGEVAGGVGEAVGDFLGEFLGGV